MNNKKLGTAWERKFCDILAKRGFWVHFISPDATGAQPFDIIAVKGGMAYAFDCKTCTSNRFTENRLEDNQRMAFHRWMMCGNGMPYIAILHDDRMYIVPFEMVRVSGSIDLSDVGMNTQICDTIFSWGMPV